MTISTDKFDSSLPCDVEPFGFIEKKTLIRTKKAGKLSIISFGALDYNNHYSPEFGGVALVHHNPDLFIAVKFIPWDVEKREITHNEAVSFLNENLDIEPNDITSHFYNEFEYTLPAREETKKREYQEAVRRTQNEFLPKSEKKIINKEMQEAIMEKNKEEDTSVDEYLDDERLI